MAAKATKMGRRTATARRPPVNPPCERKCATLTEPPNTVGASVWVDEDRVDEPEPRIETAGEVMVADTEFAEGLLLIAVNTGPAEKGLMNTGVPVAVMLT